MAPAASKPSATQNKGKAKRVLKDRSYIYRPAGSRIQAQKYTIRDRIDRMFGGSAEALVMGLLDTKQITPAKLAELQKRVEGRKP